MYKVDMECLSHILGEYYIYTRRYDKAEYVLKKALIKEVNNEERELIEEKINDCEKRKNQYKKEYIPNPIEGKNQYKDFMKEIGIDVNIEIRNKKNLNEISKEIYPMGMEQKEADFNSFIAFDLETTGFAKYDEIIEIGAVKVVDGKIIDKFSALVKPSRRKISSRITEITGITQEMVANEKEISEVLTEFLDFVGNEILLGHNVVSFDSRFLLESGRKNGIIINNLFFDVLRYVRSGMTNRRFNKTKLSDLCLELNIKNENAHRALSDAEAVAKVYLKLVEYQQII